MKNKRQISEEQFKKMELLIQKSFASKSHFFSKADADWLEILTSHDYFKKAPSVIREKDLVKFPPWPESRYLARIASKKPTEAMAIILDMVMPKDANPYILADLVDAMINMPIDISMKIIEKIKKEEWVKTPYDFLLPHKLNEYLKKLIEEKKYHQVLDLTNILLDVKLRHLPEGKEYTGYRDAEGFIKDYDYGQVLETIKLIPDTELKPFIKTLVNILDKAILLEVKVKKEKDSKEVIDWSSIWRPAIEFSKQNIGLKDVKEMLVDNIRDLSEKYINYVLEIKGNVNQELEGILETKHFLSILQRFRLHIYRIFKQAFKAQIEKATIDYFYDSGNWHEYALLVKESFGDLSQPTQENYLNLIEEGPKNKEKEEYIKYWKAKRVSLIRKYLNKTQQKNYLELLKLVPDSEKETSPSYSTSWVGPTSPQSKEKLEKKDIDVIIEDLISWKPSNETFSPSPEGFGRTFQSVIEERSEEFSKKCESFLNEKIRPVYLYHLFEGLRNGLKKEVKLDWEQIAKTAYSIIQESKKKTLPIFEATQDDLETNWNGVFKAIADLLEDGLFNEKQEQDFKLRDNIFEIIEYLCSNPDPTPEHEKTYGGENMDPFTLSINTVRGQAFHALFAYMFWCNRHLRKSKEDNVIVDEVKTILKKHLDIKIEPSLTIRSVYGRYLPWLYSFDKKWTLTIFDELLPKDDKERRYAAWEAYLSNSVYNDVFKALEDNYRLAIEELKTAGNDKRHWLSPVRRLAEHVAIGYLYKFEDSKNPLSKSFFEKSNAKQKGMFISFIGRAYITCDKDKSREKFPDKKGMKELWEYRLEKSSKIEELKEFGWWIKENEFDNKWMLEMLNKTLEKTKGIIDADFIVFETIDKLSSDYPLLTISILDWIIRGKDRTLYFAKNEAENIINNTYQSNNEEAQKIARRVCNYLVSMGFEKYRHTIDN